MAEDRYQRHALIDWLSQDALKAMHVAVVGAGAVGNEVVKNLTLFGVGRIDVFDFDTIEVHNLTRSVLFRETDVGRNKADCVAMRGSELDGNVKFRAIHGDFWKTLSLSGIAIYDVVISCVDSIEGRMRLNLMCRLAGVDFINTGIDSRFALVETLPFRQSPDSGCYECGLPNWAYRRVKERYSCGWLPRRAIMEKKIPTTIVTASVGAALAVSAALRMRVEPQGARRAISNTISGTSIASPHLRRTDCAGCGWIAGAKSISTLPEPTTAAFARACKGQSSKTHVRASDGLIFSARCTNCSYALDGDAPVLHRAADYDEGLVQCPQCRTASVDVDVRDSFTLGELTALPPQPIPVKFLVLEQEGETVVFDLETGHSLNKGERHE